MPSPNRIFLQVDLAEEKQQDGDYYNVTWCSDRINDEDVEYVKLDVVREAFREYYRTEGCGCCSDYEEHKAAMDRMGELLGLPRYDDDSGVNVLGVQVDE